MDADLVYRPEVEVDLDEAYGWYESHQPGTGETFLTSVDACVQAIRRFPEIRVLYYKHYRRVLLRKFPYAVYYSYDQGTVTIYGVFHTSLDQAKWRRRLP